MKIYTIKDENFSAPKVEKKGKKLRKDVAKQIIAQPNNIIERGPLNEGKQNAFSKVKK